MSHQGGHSQVSRICLGTVQFGLDYGIANKAGKVAGEKVFEILDCAADTGINYLDTAFDYGDSEDLIGAFFKNRKNDFHIVSKFPPKQEHLDQTVEEIVRVSLKRLNKQSLNGYLIHQFDDFSQYPGLWDELICLRTKGFIEKIGFSLYCPQDLEALLDQKIDFDIVQLPYSVFDRRFEKYFENLKQNNVDIYARSIFLQGLAFLTTDQLQGDLLKARKNVQALHQLAKDQGISVSALCLNYVLLNQHVDKVVVGIDRLSHLKEHIESLGLLNELQPFEVALKDLIIEDEDVLLPFKWQGV